jgi:hypothetical protein
MPQKDTLYGDLFVVGNFEANLIKKTGGTSSEFLKADGSVDSTAYLTTTPTLAQVTTAGNTTTNAITVGDVTSTGVIKSVVSSVTAQFTAVNPAGSYPRAHFQIGQSAGDNNVGLVIAPFYSSAGVQKPAFVQVSTNKNTLDSGQFSGYFIINTSTFTIGSTKVDGTVSGGVPIIFAPAATEAMRIQNNGNIQIGTTTDAGYKLDVNGTFRVVSDSVLTGNVTMAGSTVYAYTYSVGGLSFYVTNTGHHGARAIHGKSAIGIIGESNLGAGPNTTNAVGLMAVRPTSPLGTTWTDTDGVSNTTYKSIGLYAQRAIITDSTASTMTNGVMLQVTGATLITGSVTANALPATPNIAYGLFIKNTLVAAANNDVLIGLDINPTFTSGAFTGLGKIAARIQSGALLVGTTLLNTDVISFPVQVNGSSQNIGAVWRNALSTGYTSFRFYNDQNLNTRAMEMGYAGSAYPSAIVTGGVTGESAYLTTTGAYPLQLGTNNTARFIVFSNGNVGVGTATDAGQKLQVIGSVFIKGTDSLSSTKVFEVQNGAGASIMDFRNATYAFFGCGQGGGSNSGFIFNYSNTSYTQFAGYNYGAGAGSYKPILMDTDTGGRNQGIFVNFGVTTNTPPNSDTEFGVLGRTSDSTTYISRFRNSGNTDKFAIRADGALFTNTLQGYSGTLNIPTNPPGTSNITITNGLITNIA